jgi:hypothetical protein
MVEIHVHDALVPSSFSSIPFEDMSSFHSGMAIMHGSYLRDDLLLSLPFWMACLFDHWKKNSRT